MSNKIFFGFDYTYGNKKESYKPFFYERFDDYINHFETINYNKKDIFIINIELYSNSLKPSNFKGVDLIKWLRIKLNLLNPIIAVGFAPFNLIYKIKPDAIFLLGNSIAYKQLPYSVKSINKLITLLKPINNSTDLHKVYTNLVNQTFNITNFEHSFANKYGIKLMQEALQNCTNKTFSVNSKYSFKNSLDFAKADFLYKNNSFIENSYFKSQIIDRTDKGSLPAFRNFVSTKKCKIFHVDDEGETENWYNLIKSLGNLNDSNYKTVPKEKLIVEEQINTSFVLNLIEDFKPNLILIDLRLLGQKEANLEDFSDFTGAELIEDIRQVNPWIPIIVVSATAQIKSLENLKKHPYNITSLWSKPRVDNGLINIYEKLNDLLFKMNQALELYSNEVEKHNAATDYHISEYFKSKTTLDNFPNCTHYLLDTNCLMSKKATSTRLHLALHRFITEDYKSERDNPKVIVLRDVVAELQKLSFIPKLYIKEEERYEELEESVNRIGAATFGLERLKKLLLKDTKITDFYDDSRYILNDKIDYEINFKNEIELKFSKVIAYAASKEDAKIIKEELQQSNSKTIIHADDVFRIILKSKVKSKNSKITMGLISSDRKLQNLIVKDLDNFGLEIIRNNAKFSKDTYIQIKKGNSLKAEIIGENYFVKKMLKEDEYKTTWFK